MQNSKINVFLYIDCRLSAKYMHDWCPLIHSILFFFFLESMESNCFNSFCICESTLDIRKQNCIVFGQYCKHLYSRAIKIVTLSLPPSSILLQVKKRIQRIILLVLKTRYKSLTLHVVEGSKVFTQHHLQSMVFWGSSEMKN